MKANAVTAEKISTDAIRSRNYVKDTAGTFINLADGSWDSKYTKIDSEGKISCSDMSVTGGSIVLTSTNKCISINQNYIQLSQNDEDTSFSTELAPGMFRYNCEYKDRTYLTQIYNGTFDITTKCTDGSYNYILYRSDEIAMARYHNNKVYTMFSVTSSGDINTAGDVTTTSGASLNGLNTTVSGLSTSLSALQTNVATYYQPFGSSGASLKSGQNLNEFYSGVILGAGMGNAPDGDWWLVVSGGTGGTTVQRAYNLWSGRCNWRYCAGGNWTAWQASLSCGDITGTGAITISNGNMTSAGVITNALRTNALCMPTRAGAQTTAKPNVYFDTAGNLYKTSTTSSKRFKEDVKLVENEDLNPENLYDIDVVQFKYKKSHFTNKEDPRYRKDMIGLIAENVYEHYPMAADYHIGDDGNVVCDGWNEQYLIPAMLKLIQDQHMQLINQERKIKILEDKVMFM